MSVAVGRLPPSQRRVVGRTTTTARTTRTVADVRPSAFVVLVATVTVLNIVGVVMVLSASSVASITMYGSAWHVFQRQAVWTILGAIAFTICAHLDYRSWRRWVRPLLAFSIVLLVLVLVPGIGIEVSGARRWLGVGSWRFQPTELVKVALLVYACDVVARRADQLHDWRRVARPVLLVFLGIATLVVLQPDLDSTIVLALIGTTVLVVGGVRLQHLAVLGSALAAAVYLLAVAAPYRRARVLTYLHPWSDPANTGYQVSQSLIALGSGGWTGVGLGAGRAKWQFLPNAHTDFIFAIIGEEVGLVGCLLVLGLFVAFAVLGARIAMRAEDRFGTLLAAGVTAWVTGQAVINIGGVVGALPVSGIPLPFVSFGGSALVFTMAAAGLLASVARRTS